MKWEKKDIPGDWVRNLAAKYGCDLLTASILVRRGITKGEDILYFLEDDPRYLRNPFYLPDMEDAVDRILAAKEEGEKVLIFGDRDVDGVTSAAMVTGFLRGMGMDVSWRLPLGDEPYGLSIAAVEEFAASYGTLIVTVDCGISNTAEVERAKALGVDVIITDHHNPQERIPAALAIVNPKLPGSRYPFRDLAGCGAAYKLVSALRFALKSETYGQSICLLNTRPSNDSYIIEIAKIRNLAVIDRLTETVVPGMVGIGETRLPRFLEGQHILTWDAPLQKKTLAKIFGSGVDIQMLDIAPEIGREIKQAAGQSLLRIKELSRIAKYADKPLDELDVFINLFTSFIQRRAKLFSGDDAGDLQLAALGTIADIMPLKDENRIIVRRGLEALAEKPRPGISDLLFKLDLAGKHIGSYEISWKLSPAVNSAGRMGSPDKAVSLFLADDPGERDRLADEIIAMNEERKKLGMEAWSVVEPMAAKNFDLYGGKLAFAFGDTIYRGITGIMANRLTGRFRAPALVVSFGEAIITGSLRSIRGYDLRFLLERCSDLFSDWGGHDFAAGFSMEKDAWEPFLLRLRTAAAAIELGPDEEGDCLTVDAELSPDYLTPDLFRVVDRLAPYGEEHGPLVFMARRLTVTDISFMGKPEAKHVKLTLDTGRYKWPALYWQAA
ncbi:MAG: single-stranded-DNA-specific exonuclease RecJ, partial [Spirochaetaceae bacterium]|nr:single-stranded-DNA-specific exonuclease RecJ [Spirochaetaceae bacterium]